MGSNLSALSCCGTIENVFQPVSFSRRRTGSGTGDTNGLFAAYVPGLSARAVVEEGLAALTHRRRAPSLIAQSHDGEVTFASADEAGAASDSSIAAGGGYGGDKGAACFAAFHDGNVLNGEELEAANDFAVQSGDFGHLLAQLVIDRRTPDVDPLEALLAVLSDMRGAFAFAALDGDRLIGARDPNGLRPLCLGRLDTGWVIASESCALDAVGARFVRDIDPGEALLIDESGLRSLPFSLDRVEPRPCALEHVALARADSRMYGGEVHGSRRRTGLLLAEEAPLPPSDRFFDRPALVAGIPQTGVAAAEGYALGCGLPLGEALLKVPGRKGTPSRLRPLQENVSGKRIVLVEGAVADGNALQQVVSSLRIAGAVEVHLRVGSPPLRWPCFYGVATGSRVELLAAGLDSEDMRQYLGADSIAFLSTASLKLAIGGPNAGMCVGCFSGSYPTSVPLEESSWLANRESTVHQ